MRPRVLLNCAVSSDGHLAGPDGAPVRLSDEEDMHRVHTMRASVDAILVGINTVLTDDPGLRIHDRYRKEGVDGDPVRVILDTRLRCPENARVLGEDTIIYHAADAEARNLNATMVAVERDETGLRLDRVLDDLGERGITTIMVEGGAEVLASFLRDGHWEQFTVYAAPVHLGGGPALPSGARLREWGVIETSEVAAGDGWVRTFSRAR